jgi:hypothetical protein
LRVKPKAALGKIESKQVGKGSNAERSVLICERERGREISGASDGIAYITTRNKVS